MALAGRRWPWILTGLVFGCGLLWFALRSISVPEVVDSIRHARSGYLLTATGLSILFVALKTQRWAILLRPICRLRFRELHASVYAGAAANLAISHAGEFVRARMLDRRAGITGSTILASIGLERVFDMLAMLLLVGYLFVAGGGRLTPALSAAAQVAAALSLTAAAGILAVVLWPDYWAATIDRLSARWPEGVRAWIRRHFHGTVSGLASIRNPARALVALVFSVALWCVIAASIWCCLKAVSVAPGITPAVAVLVLMVAGLTLPTAPGYLGTTQVAFTTALGVFAVAEEAAFAASVLYSAFVVLPPFLIGGICLLRYSSAR